MCKQNSKKTENYEKVDLKRIFQMRKGSKQQTEEDLQTPSRKKTSPWYIIGKLLKTGKKKNKKL